MQTQNTHNTQESNTLTLTARPTRSKRFVLTTLALLLLSPTAVLATPQDEDTVLEDATAESTTGSSSGGKTFGKTTVLDEVVVTATRSEERVREIPAKVEVVDSHDIEMTTGQTITEQLKKHSSLDVIEYPSTLAGIGIRGFRPEYNAGEINKHTLTLVNGRPVGSGNLATVLTGDIERVEILKGPASSLYGAEAMGGVVNIITKSSKGAPAGFLKVGGGSFETFYQQAGVGGTLFGPLDFDLNARNYAQNGDITMGDGEKRPNTSFHTRNASLRIGADIGDAWRADASFNGYQGRDIQNPGDIRYEGETQSKEKDLDNYGADLRISGQLGENDKISLTAYQTKEKVKNYEKYKSVTVDGESVRVRVPSWEYYALDTTWTGLQLQNVYNWGDHSFIVGGDYQYAKKETKYWQRREDALGNALISRRYPSSPNSNRTNWAGYGETVWKFFDRHLVLTAGGRYDHFKVETLETPYYPQYGTYTPGSATFGTFSPRVGATFLMDNGLRLHTTLGQAFVPPDAADMAGYSSRQYSAQGGYWRDLVGNSNLDPEKSTTWDVGLGFDRKEWGLSFDVTYFYTKVKDRITTTDAILTGESRLNEAGTKYIPVRRVDNVNSDDSEMQGLETALSLDFGVLFDWGRSLKLYLNSTNYFKAEETLSGKTRRIRNVAKYTYNYGIGYEDNDFDAKLHFRSLGDRTDLNWISGLDDLEYPTVTLADLVFSYSFLDHHKLTFTIDNIFDKNYYEKIGYPKPGRAFFLSYTYKF